MCATNHNTVQMKYALGSMYYVGSVLNSYYTSHSWEHYTHTLCSDIAW